MLLGGVYSTVLALLRTLESCLKYDTYILVDQLEFRGMHVPTRNMTSST